MVERAVLNKLQIAIALQQTAQSCKILFHFWISWRS